MRFSFLTLLFLHFCISALAQNDTTIVIGNADNVANGEATVYGTVTVDGSDEAIQGVTVFIAKLNKGTATDDEGQYRLTIPPGKYEIQFQHLGMETVIQKITVYSGGELNISIKDKPLDMEEVIVRANRDEENILSTVTGVENVNLADLEQLPVLLGEIDVVNSLVNLPGVNTVGEGSSGFNVRGGRTDQNLILMEGAQLFNSSHVLGLLSVYNQDATESYSLYKGHIPAKYGGRLSSVLDVKMKSGSLEKFRLDGGVGIVSARLMAEGPIQKEQTSFLLAGRGSYSDWVMGLVKNMDVRNSKASFYDSNLNLTHRINRANTLELSLYNSYDYFRFTDQFGYSWNNRIANLSWTSQLGQNIFLDAFAVRGNYENDYFDPAGPEAFNLNSGMNYFKAKAEILYLPGDAHTFNGGMEWNIYVSTPETIEPYNTDSLIGINRIKKERGREIAFYISDEITVTRGIVLSLGLRYSFFQNYGPAEVFSYSNEAPRSVQTISDTTFYGKGEIIKNFGGPEPRISSRFSLSESSSIKLSYNLTRQYIHQISNSTSPTPADIWQVSNLHIPDQKASNYSIGLFKNFNDHMWKSSIELFYRDMSNLVEYVDFANLFQNPHLETELIAGTGKAYGGEFSIRKTAGKWTGWLSYSLTRSFVKTHGEVVEKQINNNRWFPSNYDQPHNVNLVAKKRLGKRSAFSMNFTYRSGRPITALESNYVNDNVVVPIFSDRNRYRIPDYIRLDISFTIAENIWKNRTVNPNRRYKDSMSISFYNLLGRENAFSVFYRRQPNSTVPGAHKLSVLGATIPSITYNFSF